MNMEFEKVRDLIPLASINISATNEHKAKVQRRIQTIKVRCQGVLGTLAFTHLSQQLIIDLVQLVTI